MEELRQSRRDAGQQKAMALYPVTAQEAPSTGLVSGTLAHEHAKTRIRSSSEPPALASTYTPPARASRSKDTPAWSLPKATEYARSRMAAILTLLDREGGRLNFQTWEALAARFDAEGLIPRCHPSNLRYWVEILQGCKIATAGSPAWVVQVPPEGSDGRSRPRSGPAPGRALRLCVGLAELAAAGWHELAASDKRARLSELKEGDEVA